MFGVSPAFALSGYGREFSLENYCAALPRIRRLGFDKMPLGQGTVPWAPLLRNLRAARYQGSLDIEIGCPAGEVEQHYLQGLEYLQELVDTPKGDRA